MHIGKVFKHIAAYSGIAKPNRNAHYLLFAGVREPDWDEDAVAALRDRRTLRGPPDCCTFSRLRALLTSVDGCFLSGFRTTMAVDVFEVEEAFPGPRLVTLGFALQCSGGVARL